MRIAPIVVARMPQRPAPTWPIEAPEAIATPPPEDRSVQMPWPGTKITEPVGAREPHQVTVEVQGPTVPMEPFLRPEAVEPTTGAVRQPEVIHHRPAITRAGAQGVTNPLEGPHLGPATTADLPVYQEVQVTTEAVEVAQGVQAVIGVPVEVTQEALVGLVDLQDHLDLAGGADHNSHKTYHKI